MLRLTPNNNCANLFCMNNINKTVKYFDQDLLKNRRFCITNRSYAETYSKEELHKHVLKNNIENFKLTLESALVLYYQSVLSV
jgi:hypothetical protein